MEHVTIKEVDYSVSIEGDDILLDSVYNDLILQGGYQDLKSEIIANIGYPVCEGDDEWTTEYNPDQLDMDVSLRLVGYVLDHFDEFEILEP